MRATISLPDDLAAQVHAHLGDRSFSDFAREALAERVVQLERERLAEELRDGYRAEATEPSLDDAWAEIETEGW